MLIETTKQIEVAVNSALTHLQHSQKTALEYNTIAETTAELLTELSEWKRNHYRQQNETKDVVPEHCDAINEAPKVSDDRPYQISHVLVCKLSKYLVTVVDCGENEDWTFESLTRGSKMILNSPKPLLKSDKLQKILAAAKIQSENAEYLRMTKDVVPKTSMTQLMRQERSEYKTTVGMFSAIFNVFLSMVAVFMAIFWVGHTVFDDVGLKTLLALFFALVAGVAEGWFFSRDWLFEDRK
ncbi:hypothetical protein HK100_001827 [Physocladia obscura]|uniref:Uncharacterized protein n=1 Tax=Physocladia obscura TaxID=109957 RepID=A0AAD5XFW2_9FUNG|nr:hypothetical protein HK100_001827 [Physocladia obscura]